MGEVCVEDGSGVTVALYSRCPAVAVDALDLTGNQYFLGEIDRMHLEHERSGGEVSYVVAQLGSRIVGLTPFYRRGRRSTDLTELLAGQPGSVALAGSQGTFENFWKLATDLTPPQQSQVAAAMVAGMRISEAHQSSLMIAAPYMAEHQVAWLADMPGTRLPVRQKAVLPVTWSCFDDYVSWLPHARRPDVRRERRRFLQSGLVVAQEDLVACAAEVAPLICATEARYGHIVTAEELTGYLLMTALSFGNDVVALVARREGRAVAVSTLMKDGSVWHVRSWGCDYLATTERDCAYFNLIYYEPLLLAMKCCDVVIDFSVGSLRSKTLRGAQLQPLHGVLVGEVASSSDSEGSDNGLR